MPTITTSINLALEYLEKGEVVAIPTETVYGLAADATNETAIKKIFSIKKRPLNHPLIMHVCHDWDLSQWVTDVPEYAQQMILAFWPGPLTLVLNSKQGAVNSLVNGGQNSIAIRAPKHSLTEQLLRRLNRPLVAPSANPFGQISPTTAVHVAQSFPNKHFLILDGGRCAVGIESSIIQATHNDRYTILRPGMLDLKDMKNRLAKECPYNTSSPRVPGQLDSHYKPKKVLYYIDDWQQFDNYSHGLIGKIYTISISEHTPGDGRLHHQLPNDDQIVAYELYNELRHADQSQADIIVIELPPNQIKWHAIREKIIKAGQPIDSIK
ncbi:MAG: L-threonylcarbamoyladenylate synthase [Gammaproteobacteria bacterium]